MQVTTQQEGNTLSVTIKEGSVKLQKYRLEATKRISEQREISGYRKGGAPEEAIIKDIGEERFLMEVADTALNALLPKAYAKVAEFQVVNFPGQIESIESYDPLEVTFKMETMPVVKIDPKKLKKISVELPESKVTAKEVNTELENLQKKFTTYTPDETHTIANGDRVLVQAKGFDTKGGTSIDSMSLTDFSLDIGSGRMIPGFEEEFIGKKQGDDVNFDITFPKDYHAEEFAGNRYYFECQIDSVDVATVPDLEDEEFLNKVAGEGVSLVDFKKRLKSIILGEKQQQARNQSESELMTQLVETFDVEVGAAMVGKEIDHLWERESRSLEQQGLKAADYLQHMGTTEEKHKEKLRPQAEKNAKIAVILNQMRKDSPQEVSQDEIVEEVTKRFTLQGHEVDEKWEKMIKDTFVPGSQNYEEVRQNLEYTKLIDGFFVAPKKKEEKK